MPDYQSLEFEMSLSHVARFDISPCNSFFASWRNSQRTTQALHNGPNVLLGKGSSKNGNFVNDA